MLQKMEIILPEYIEEVSDAVDIHKELEDSLSEIGIGLTSTLTVFISLKEDYYEAIKYTVYLENKRILIEKVRKEVLKAALDLKASKVIITYPNSENEIIEV